MKNYSPDAVALYRVSQGPEPLPQEFFIGIYADEEQAWQNGTRVYLDLWGGCVDDFESRPIADSYGWTADPIHRGL